jgi:hypothetical protein
MPDEEKGTLICVLNQAHFQEDTCGGVRGVNSSPPLILTSQTQQEGHTAMIHTFFKQFMCCVHMQFCSSPYGRYGEQGPHQIWTSKGMTGWGKTAWPHKLY